MPRCARGYFYTDGEDPLNEEEDDDPDCLDQEEDEVKIADGDS